jgi:hypothetical protein
MSSVVISGDTSGAITLSAPAISGTNTATLPAATGTVMVSGNMPAFSAYPSANQTGLTNGTFTKVVLNTEDFDTASAFDSTTNYRFTPQVAGYYQINAGVCGDAATINPSFVYANIYKNGSGYRSTVIYVAAGTNATANISTVLFLNGSTDYVELYGRVDGATGGRFSAIYSTGYSTFMNGSLVRAT